MARLEGSRIKVYQIAIDHVHQWTVGSGEIHEQYPHLPLAQIYSALAYYYDHQAGIEADIARRRQYAEKMEAEATNQLTREELLERVRQRGIRLHAENEYAQAGDEAA